MGQKNLNDFISSGIHLLSNACLNRNCNVSTGYKIIDDLVGGLALTECLFIE